MVSMRDAGQRKPRWTRRGRGAAMEAISACGFVCGVPYDPGPMWLQLAIHLSALPVSWEQDNTKTKPK